MNIPPIHPAVAHLPIAFVILSVIADFSARITKEEKTRAMFRTVGFWSLAAGFVAGGLTIVAGYIDLKRTTLLAETHQLVDLHMTLGWALAIGLLILTAWRWLIWHRGQMTINTSYLVAGSFMLVLVIFQGWYGAEMVYSYGAGVAPAGQGTETAETAQGRLIVVHNFFEPGSAVGGAESPGGTNSSPGSINPQNSSEY